MRTNKILVLVSVITLIYTGNNAKCSSTPGQYVYQSTATELTAQELIKSCKKDWEKLQVELNTNIDKDKNLTSNVRIGKYIKFRQQLRKIIKRVNDIIPTDNDTALIKKDFLDTLNRYDEMLVRLSVPRDSNFLYDNKLLLQDMEHEITSSFGVITKECYRIIEKLQELKMKISELKVTNEEKKPLLDQLKYDREKLIKIVYCITTP